ncbi:hypothetical protein BKI52_40950 [marine bacterium AO1-C]|nr:hypothetical protein BKI52_40950 [marine bacterium AO1-C]
MKKFIRWSIGWLSIHCLAIGFSFAQQSSNKGTISGSLQSDFQYYQADSVINATISPGADRMASNHYLNLFYRKGSFTAGVRYEAYLPPLIGYPLNFKGQGIVNRFVSYQKDGLEVTAGHFYEQFGNGAILRAQENRPVGIDNAIDGISLKYRFDDLAQVKALTGKQRDGFTMGEGTIRAVDGEVYLNKLLFPLSNTNITVGGSFVSNYEPYTGTLDYVDPQSDAFAGRLSIGNGVLNMDAEYVYKKPTPMLSNNYINHDGSAVFLDLGYANNGLGINIQARRIENMDYRSNREAELNSLMINFIPVNTKQHTYRLLTLYPYATQVFGEVGIQADLVYTFKRGSALGGKYGTTLSFNFAVANSIDQQVTNTQQGYTSDFWKIGNRKYFQDFNVEFSKKWSRSLKTNFTYVYLEYDKDQIEGTSGFGVVKSHTVVADILIKPRHSTSVRLELQHLATRQDFGSWAMALVEVGFGNFLFFASDEINYNGLQKGIPIHYYNGGLAFAKGANRFSLSYGRQRAGLICVGGVCRLVPANSGFTLTVASSF